MVRGRKRKQFNKETTRGKAQGGRVAKAPRPFRDGKKGDGAAA